MMCGMKLLSFPFPNVNSAVPHTLVDQLLIFSEPTGWQHTNCISPTKSLLFCRLCHHVHWRMEMISIPLICLEKWSINIVGVIGNVIAFCIFVKMRRQTATTILIRALTFVDSCLLLAFSSLQLRHNGLDGVSNHQSHDCLPNCLFRNRWTKTSKLRVSGLCAGNSPVTGEFHAQMASYAEDVSLWWSHHDWGIFQQMGLTTGRAFTLLLVPLADCSHGFFQLVSIA